MQTLTGIGELKALQTLLDGEIIHRIKLQLGQY